MRLHDGHRSHRHATPHHNFYQCHGYYLAWGLVVFLSYMCVCAWVFVPTRPCGVGFYNSFHNIALSRAPPSCRTPPICKRNNLAATPNPFRRNTRDPFLSAHLTINLPSPIHISLCYLQCSLPPSVCSFSLTYAHPAHVTHHLNCKY